MEKVKYQYNEKTLWTMESPDRDLLFKSKDICNILGIQKPFTDPELSEPCLDLTSAFNISKSYNEEFAMWLLEKFVSYKKETLIPPKCNYDWSEE